VRNISLKLAQIVAAAPGAKDINFDWMEPARMVRIQIDQDQARLLGLSSAAIASVMNTVVTGTPVTQVRDGIFLVDVLTRARDEQRLSLATLRNLQIPLPNGRTVPLSQIASFDFGQEYPLIWQRDRVPTLTVRADVRPGVLPETVVQTLAPAIGKLGASLPTPFRIATGGTVE
jgi:multidrug efflux pump subunit AcrB